LLGTKATTQKANKIQTLIYTFKKMNGIHIKTRENGRSYTFSHISGEGLLVDCRIPAQKFENNHGIQHIQNTNVFLTHNI
jgi:hypothetical protein